MTQQKYIRDGKVAVLISVSHGAGWSTWNEDYPGMLWDTQIVDIVLADLDFDEMYAKVNEICAIKYPEAYTGGIDGLAVQWIPLGTQFRVREYDGAESIELCNDIAWETA